MNPESYIIRDYVPNDRNFILATWLRGTYYTCADYKDVPKDIYMENMHRVLENILDSVTEIKIAALKDDPDVILGFCVYKIISTNGDDIAIVHWLFVKKHWRKIGIGKNLVPFTARACTMQTPTSKDLIKKKNLPIIYNPFLLTA